MPQLLQHFMECEVLEPDRRLVIDAGCQLKPDWMPGFMALVPLTHDQVTESGLEITYDIVIALSSSLERMREALKEFNCRGKKRPHIYLCALSC